MFEGRVHGVCGAAVSSVRSSSSEMSDRPRSSSEMASREGGIEESEDDEEKERGNMKIDWWRWVVRDNTQAQGEGKKDRETRWSERETEGAGGRRTETPVQTDPQSVAASSEERSQTLTTKPTGADVHQQDHVIVGFHEMMTGM